MSPADPEGMCRIAGSTRLDDLLGGGLFPGEVCEVAGPSGVGKTQLCLTVAALTALSGVPVVYLDSGNGFSSERVLELLHARGSGVVSRAQVMVALTRLRVKPVHDAQHLLHMLHTWPDDDPAMLVVDAAGSLLAPLAGAGAQPSAIMEHCRQRLTSHAVAHNVPVLVRDSVAQPRVGLTAPVYQRCFCLVR